MSMSHEQVGHELSCGHLWILMGSGKYWKLRRNGKTKLWKRNLWKYRIPVKAGLYVYSEITNETEIGAFDSKRDVICSSSDPNKWHGQSLGDDLAARILPIS